MDWHDKAEFNKTKTFFTQIGFMCKDKTNLMLRLERSFCGAETGHRKVDQNVVLEKDGEDKLYNHVINEEYYVASREKRTCYIH
jgi:hypothetical protein